MSPPMQDEEFDVDLLMKESRNDAVSLARKRGYALLDRGDGEGFIEWLKLAKAIEVLHRKTKR